MAIFSKMKLITDNVCLQINQPIFTRPPHLLHKEVTKAFKIAEDLRRFTTSIICKLDTTNGIHIVTQ